MVGLANQLHTCAHSFPYMIRGFSQSEQGAEEAGSGESRRERGANPGAGGSPGRRVHQVIYSRNYFFCLQTQTQVEFFLLQVAREEHVGGGPGDSRDQGGDRLGPVGSRRSKQVRGETFEQTWTKFFFLPRRWKGKKAADGSRHGEHGSHGQVGLNSLFFPAKKIH